MLKGIVKLFGGDPHKRTMEALFPLVDEINALEPEFEKLSNEELRAKTDEFRKRLVRNSASHLTVKRINSRLAQRIAIDFADGLVKFLGIEQRVFYILSIAHESFISSKACARWATKLSSDCSFFFRDEFDTFLNKLMMFLMAFKCVSDG